MEALLAWAERQQTYLLTEIDLMISGQKATIDERDGGSFDSTSHTLSDLSKQANELEIILSRIRGSDIRRK